MKAAQFRRSLQVFVDRNLSPAAQSARLAAAAIAERDALIRSGRASSRYQRTVDGRRDAPEASVRPDGVIHYRFQYLGEAVAFGLAYLKGRTAGTAVYRSSFAVGIGRGEAAGRMIPAARFDAKLLTADATDALIFNVAPHSRLVDEQTIGGQSIRVEIPPKFFADCARELKGRFAGLDARRLHSVTFPGQYVLETGQKRGQRVASPGIRISTA